MYTAVKPLSAYLKHKSVHIYDCIFTLHSKFTVMLLCACTFLLSAKQYFGDPIQCISDHKNMDYVHSYCWTMGTFILSDDEHDLSLQNWRLKVDSDYKKNHYNNAVDSNLVYIAEGVRSATKDSKRIYLRYYQWIVLVLLLQSFVFYLPAFLWKMWEGGRLKHLCGDFTDTLTANDKQAKHLTVLVNYFSRNYKEAHFRYSVSYVLCETFNLCISVVNILLLDVFLNGFWTRYTEALAAVPAYDWQTWNKITSRIFPKVAKCELMQFGSSGSTSFYDNLCLLPLNILNEKIFAFLWVWFGLMALLAGLKLLYRVLLIFNRGFCFQLLRARARYMHKSQLQVILQNFSYGDWFVLMRVGNNISPEHFHELLQKLYEQNHLEKNSETA